MYLGSTEDPATPAPEARPAIALATVAIERALTFVAQGRITLETIQSGSKKIGHLIKADENPTTGKRLVSSINFSEDHWGVPVQDYLDSIKRLRSSDIHKILIEAKKFSQLHQNEEQDHTEDIRGQRHDPKAKSARAHVHIVYDDDNNNNNNVDAHVDVQANAKPGYGAEDDVEEQVDHQGDDAAMDMDDDYRVDPMDDEAEFDEFYHGLQNASDDDEAIVEH